MTNKETHSRPTFRELETTKYSVLNRILYILHCLFSKVKGYCEWSGRKRLEAEKVNDSEKKVFSGHRRIVIYIWTHCGDSLGMTKPKHEERSRSVSCWKRENHFPLRLKTLVSWLQFIEKPHIHPRISGKNKLLLIIFKGHKFW